MRLSEIRAETKAIVVPFQAGDLKVTYRPNVFTADAADQVNAAMADPQKQTDGLFEMVGNMLIAWDLEDEAGQVIPLEDAARLRAEVPMPIFGRILAEMQRDQSPGEAPKR